ncbi:coiled-coil domain-containing protein 116 [Tupaia chinensis]|uniref:coiled-coil domain-containing protein 116 n=1 Tax=Tupaia chinensis TaxID=246437 RepID=UPI000FFB9573|nr:coiled-coil domain-containing protein 116 [Tupaia chinensis]
MRPAPKLSRVPHPPSTYAGHRRNRRGLQPFRSFLDFLTEGQVLDSLQTVVEKATERMATVKTDAGVPLLEVQDPVEVLRGGRRARARPSQGTMHRHRVRPNLCTGHPNNYPSCSSSTSGSHSSRTAGFLGAPCWDSDLAARGAGSLPSMGDRLLLEKNLKRLQRLENKGKGRNRSWSQGDSLPWDSQGSQTSSQWTQEKPLSWFSGLLGSSSSTPEASELGPAERELTLLRGEFYKKIKSLLSQPASLDLPGYCSLHQPHQTLDFLAQHDLFPALQRVVSQAVDKLSSARRFNGFPTSGTSASQLPLPCEPPLPGSKSDTPTDREEPCDSSPTTGSSPLTSHRKSKSKTVSPTMSNPQVASRLRLKVTTMEEPNVPSHSQHPRQEATQSSSTKFSRKKPLPSISSKSSLPHASNPWFEEIVSFLVEQAVSLLICKYKYERNLRKQLGFISFPITEGLMDLLLGFKKIEGSRIRLSSQIDWSCLLRKLEEAEKIRPPSHPGAPQHSAPHSRVSQRSTVSLSTQPEPAPNTDKEKEPEPDLDTELQVRQLFNPQEPATLENEPPASASEPKLSTSSGTGMDSSPHKSRETVNFGDSEGSEEDEGDDDGDHVREDEDNLSLPDSGMEASVRSSGDIGLGT